MSPVAIITIGALIAFGIGFLALTFLGPAALLVAVPASFIAGFFTTIYTMG
jgi:hypothetical protein